jgi:hypothetical protein
LETGEMRDSIEHTVGGHDDPPGPPVKVDASEEMLEPSEFSPGKPTPAPDSPAACPIMPESCPSESRLGLSGVPGCDGTTRIVCVISR